MKFKYLFLAILITMFFGCEKVPVYDNSTKPAKPLTGFNMNIRYFPETSNGSVYDQINLLKPKLLRYPGGAITHKFNWQTGLPYESWGTDNVYPVSKLSELREATNTEIVFVLDIVNRTVEDQIEMMIASECPVKYIELGNELYSDEWANYWEPFPTGAEYADTVNAWVPALREAFPEAKIGAVVLGKTVNEALKPRQFHWNELVHNNITVELDAYIYHVYCFVGETIENRIDRFNGAFIHDTGLETWVTEYGAKNFDLDLILEVADFVDSIADISMSHVLHSLNGNYSKLTSDGTEFTVEGQAFVDRVN